MSDLYKDFSGRDFTARYEAILARLRAELPKLSDLNHDDAGVTMLRLLAREVDQLNFYLDEAFGEGFVPTAQFIQSLIDLAHLTEYLPKLAFGATTTLRISREETFDGLVDIPKLTAFGRSDELTYVTTEHILLQPGVSYVDVPAIQGTLQSVTVYPDDFQVVDLSLRPKFNLGPNVSAGSVEMFNSDLGISWTQVDSFWRSTSTDRHFVLDLYADLYQGQANTVFLVLGNGSQGRGVPEDPVTVRWIRTEGPDGNCGTGVILEPPATLSQYVTVTNTELATGGSMSESLESFRARIPEITRTQRRMVNLEDYEAMIEAIPGIAHCQAVDRNYGSEWPHLYVVLFVVPAGRENLSETLKNSVYDVCTKWGHLGSWRERYLLKDAKQIAVPVACRVSVTEGYIASAVSSAVYQAIAVQFIMGVAELFSFSSLNLVVGRIPGVSWVEFDTPVADVTAGLGQILVPGNITVALV
jgi:hypothetical protein